MKNITDMLAQNTGWLSQCFDVSASKIKMPAFIRVSPKTENPTPSSCRLQQYNIVPINSFVLVFRFGEIRKYGCIFQ